MFFPFDDDNPTQRFPVVTVTIITINVLMFLYMAALDANERSVFVANFGFVPARLRQLRDPQFPVQVNLGHRQVLLRQGRDVVRALQPVAIELPPVPRQIFRSLLSSLFLHGSIEHIMGNMWFFWIFGNNIEDRLGRIRFLAFYLAAGVFASVCHWGMTSQQGMLVPVIGASGAVAAVLGAYAVTWPHARVRSLVFLVIIFFVVETPALVVLGIWFAGQLVQALGVLGKVNLSGGVAWWAHVGGFVLGAAVIRFIVPRPDNSHHG